MAYVKQNPYPDIPDYFGQYHKWKKIVLPSGEVVYELPGHPERVFVPSLSNASGKVVLRPNPQAEITKQQEQEDQQKKLQKQQEFNQSPGGQLMPVAATVAGTVGSAWLISKYATADSPLQKVIADVAEKFYGIDTAGKALKPGPGIGTAPLDAPLPASVQASIPGAPPVTGAAPAVTGAVPTTTAGAAAQGATGNGLMTPGTGAVKVYPVGSATMPDGSPGTLMNNNTIVSNSTGQVATPTATGGWNVNTGLSVVQTGAGLYQIYTSAQEFSKDKVGGTLGIASGAANTLSGLGGLGVVGPTTAGYAGSAAGPLMAAKGAYDVQRSWEKGGEGIRGAGTELGMGAGMIIGSVVPGIGTLAGGAIGAVAGNALAYGVDRFAPGVFHKTTRQVAQGHTDDLLEAAGEDKAAQQYVVGMRNQYSQAPKDDKVFAGKYKTWEEYKKAGLEASDLTGVYGNIKTYGPAAWAGLTQEQRQAITQANIESGIYESKKGEVEITDQQKAKQNYDNVLKGFQVGVNTAKPQVVVAPPPQQTTPPVVVAPPPTTVIKAPAPLAPGQSPQAIAAAQGAYVTPGGQVVAPTQGGNAPVVVVPSTGSGPNNSQPGVPYNPTGAPIQNYRTNTRSPGIDLSGRRIAY